MSNRICRTDRTIRTLPLRFFESSGLLSEANHVEHGFFKAVDRLGCCDLVEHEANYAQSSWAFPFRSPSMTPKLLFAIGATLTIPLALGAISLSFINPVCAAKQEASFSEDVYPIFKGRCIECHHAPD